MELLTETLAFGVLPKSGIPNTVPDPIQDSGIVSISMIFNIAFNLVAGVGFAWGFISLTLGLVKLVTSAGDKFAVKDGMKRIQFGLYGVLISFGAYAIKEIISGLLIGGTFLPPGSVVIGS
jgi:hypothetical protein